MKVIQAFEGGYPEDKEMMDIFCKAHDMYSAIWDARQHIRNRLKWGENVNDQECKILEKLQGLLYVEGLEW